jgi:hypothetical protein
MAEYEIVLQLRAPADVGNDALESHMLDVLHVVESHAADIVLGPVAAVDFDGHHIDLGFCVEAESLEQTQVRLVQVLRIIEEHTDVQFTPTATSANVATRSENCSLAIA